MDDPGIIEETQDGEPTAVIIGFVVLETMETVSYWVVTLLVETVVVAVFKVIG